MSIREYQGCGGRSGLLLQGSLKPHHDHITTCPVVILSPDDGVSVPPTSWNVPRRRATKVGLAHTRRHWPCGQPLPRAYPFQGFVTTDRLRFWLHRPRWLCTLSHISDLRQRPSSGAVTAGAGAGTASAAARARAAASTLATAVAVTRAALRDFLAQLVDAVLHLGHHCDHLSE